MDKLLFVVTEIDGGEEEKSVLIVEDGRPQSVLTRMIYWCKRDGDHVLIGEGADLSFSLKSSIEHLVRENGVFPENVRFVWVDGLKSSDFSQNNS